MPVLREAFGIIYAIKDWSIGIKSMIEVCCEYGLPDSAFTELGTNLRIEFFRKNVGVKLSVTQKKILH